MSRNGQEYDIRASGAPIRSHDGKVVGAVLVFRDATEEIALNERIISGEKMQAVGQLAGGIAHDINNNLAIIRGHCELLMMRDDIAEKVVRDKMSQIMSSCDRATGLIDKLNAFAQQEISRFDPTNVEELISATLEVLRSTADRRVQLSIKATAENAKVNGNSSVLQSAFLNICLNAMQAMPDGGRLVVSIDEIVIDDPARSKFASFDLAPGNYVSVTFSDTGPGIPNEILRRIFEPYFSTKTPDSKTGGSGLGLAMVYGTIREHGGAIVAENAASGGAVFSLVLPQLDDQHQLKAELTRADEPDAVAPLAVLVVDDEPALVDICSAMLSQIGCMPVPSCDSEEALDIYREKAQELDLAILDVNMPKMSGIQLLRKLKEINEQVSVILITGFSDRTLEGESPDPAVFRVLQKPFSFSALTSTIHEFEASQRH